jgi:hypothetical protein
MRFLILGLWGAAAVAYGADNSTSRLLACAKVSADAERLSCYDELARGLRSPAAGGAPVGSAATAPATTTPAPVPATSGSAATQASQAREFGLPPVKAPPPDEVKSVKATVTATQHAPNGALVIELDNGQRWQQLGTADIGLQVGDSVTISRALLGSFWLAPPSGRGSKVSRLR